MGDLLFLKNISRNLRISVVFIFRERAESGFQAIKAHLDD